MLTLCSGWRAIPRLEAILAPQMREAAAAFKETGQRARIFTEFQYETLDSWSRPRARDWQGGAYRRKSQPALRGDFAPRRILAGSTTLRRPLLCAWGHGESDQGTTVIVCRSRQRRNHAGQPAADLFFSARLPAPGWVTPISFNRDRHGHRSGGNDSSSITQDRRSPPHHHPQNLDLHGGQLSQPTTVPARLDCPALLTSPGSLTIFLTRLSACLQNLTFGLKSHTLTPILRALLSLGPHHPTPDRPSISFAPPKNDQSSSLVRNAG